MCSNENDAKLKGTSGRKSTKGKQRPAYKRRVKPPYSYVELITMAILSSPTQMKTLREILDFMQTKYECFRGTYVGWKNSVRHNLSAAECFTKVLRNEQRPYGKDNYWMLNANCTHCFNNSVKGSGGSKRKMSSTSGATKPAPSPTTQTYGCFESFHHQTTPVSSPTMSDYDAGFNDSDSSVHQWVVANQTLSPRMSHDATSDAAPRAPVQYIELRHTNPFQRPGAASQNRDISTFDFSSSFTRLSCMYEDPIDSKKPMTSCTPSPSSPYHHGNRAQSSSSATESIATAYSSGFESCNSEAFDLEPMADHLYMIMDMMDDLFVPEDDLDLSLYDEDWPNTKMEKKEDGREYCKEVRLTFSFKIIGFCCVLTSTNFNVILY